MNKITRRTTLGLMAVAPLATRAMAATHQVSIEGFKFSPAKLSVAAGDTVVFTNNDGAPHTATAKDDSFNTGTLQKGQSADVTVPAGSHDFFCKFHPNMKGTITAA